MKPDTLTKSDAKTIQINPQKIALILASFLLLLVLLSLIGQYLRFFTPYEEAFGLIPLVNIARNLSIPTIFEVLLLLFAAIIFDIIARISREKKDGFQRHWKALAYIFIYISLDVGTGVYKLLYTPLRNAIRTLIPDYAMRSWHLTPLIILIIILIFKNLYQSLPVKTRKWVAISAILYLAGFIASKLIAGIYVHIYTKNNYLYAILMTVVRTLEISSVITIIYTLLDYCQNACSRISLKFLRKS